jgi:hypothetical protein
MIAKIDEDQLAMIALSVDPARQADRLAHIGLDKLAACMRAIGVHLDTPNGNWRLETGATTPGRAP